MQQIDLSRKLRVLLAAPEDQAVAMRACLAGMGHEVVGSAPDGPLACHLAQDMAPDAVLLDASLAQDGLRGLAPWPVVLVASDADVALERLAGLPEAAGLVIPPLEPDNLGPALALALSNQARLSRLRRQVAELRRSLAERKTVERAKGLVMQRLGLDESEARAVLEEQARRQGLSLPELASGVIESGELMAGESQPG
ncbi:MAG: ANTAR domain-containing protein [Desulfarculaceae bacterium]|nr:ANTAR domain-containing protein [Desulfarculaceae bacterium]MCF8072064.1 ANTAR domain-containing protein [Desulfarculaceae bacterium]MCF8101581.1 ANTAR domain-containing protein [Desulfarculaceae bacterium]MCF8115131.1 ANTAR domain-containing protein [Desulfarculaceae bacterium]